MAKTETQAPTMDTGLGVRAVWYQRYAVVIFLLFVVLETMLLRWNFLWKIQELDLFVFSASYLHETFQQAGGATRYVGSFLTQFFYYPWLGCLMYALLLIVAARLTALAFNLKKHLRPYSYIPVLAVLLTLTELGYDMISLNVHGYAFVVPIGLTALISGFLWYRKLNSNQARSGYIFGWTLLAYPLFGVYALMGTLIMLLFTLRIWNERHSKWAWMPLLVGLASLIMLPLLIDNILFRADGGGSPYSALLPYFSSDKAYLWLPYIVLVVSLLTMVLIFPLQSPTTLVLHQRRASFILCGATLLMVHVCSIGDKTFYTELAMERAFSTDNWQEVLRLSNRVEDQSSELTTSYTDLARYKLGLMDSPPLVSASPLSGAFIYYEFGDAENALRWSMKHAALYGMNAYVLKYLILSARTTDNYTLANKFIQPLEGTLFYRKWALEQASLIERSLKSTTLP